MNFIETQSTVFACGLFCGMILMIELGRRVGARQRARITEGGAAGIGAVEAAIFALLGLLIAFTFQGASARFDTRRALIVQEANNIGTAWLRIDLLPTGTQSAMRGLFRHYLDSRLETYRKTPSIVFSMLSFLACAAAFMAGHGMSGSKTRSWVHIVAFASILAVTVFVITDLEYPRLGTIRVDNFDQVLVDLRQSMK